jgi:hypothetical protein
MSQGILTLWPAHAKGQGKAIQFWSKVRTNTMTSSLAAEESYKEHLVAYLDIMGFTDKVKKSTGEQNVVSMIRHALRVLEQHMETVKKDGLWPLPPLVPQANFEASLTMFSDGLLVSFEEMNNSSLSGMLNHVMLLQCSLVLQGNLLRGAIVFGKHYEKGRVTFGPALIEALELEKLASWPRVAIHPLVMKKISTPFREHIEKRLCLVARDNDGLPYVNYLHAYDALARETRWLLEYQFGSLENMVDRLRQFMNTDMISEHKQAIENAVSAQVAKDDVPVLAKYHSLASYHNSVIDNLQEYILGASRYVTLDLDKSEVVDHLSPFMASSFRGLAHARKSSIQHVNAFLISKFKEHDKWFGNLEDKRIKLRDRFPMLY